MDTTLFCLFLVCCSWLSFLLTFFPVEIQLLIAIADFFLKLLANDFNQNRKCITQIFKYLVKRTGPVSQLDATLLPLPFKNFQNNLTK